MTRICTLRPTQLPVSIEQVRANMRIDGEYMDALLTQWLQGVTATTEHDIGQCLMRQTWEVRLDAFPAMIDLPHPVLAVSSVKYIDTDGIERILAQPAYRLIPARYQSILAPSRGATWPATWPEQHAVVVTVECGYGDTPEQVPPNVRLYLLAKLADQFDPNTRSEKESAPSPFIARLLDACRSQL